jgi:hypothetical protein
VDACVAARPGTCLSENHVCGIYGVAFVLRGFDRDAAQLRFIRVLGFVTVAANDFLSDSDPNQPPVLLRITGDFHTVCLHAL